MTLAFQGISGCNDAEEMRGCSGTGARRSKRSRRQVRKLIKPIDRAATVIEEHLEVLDA